MIQFDNSKDIGIISQGVLEFLNINNIEILEYKIERRLRTKPFLGMRQPTPYGAFLGLECVLLLGDKNQAKGYRFRLFEENKEIFGGFIKEKGISEDLQIPLSFRGIKNYSIEILGPPNS
jgi:hypothetical protein